MTRTDTKVPITIPRFVLGNAEKKKKKQVNTLASHLCGFES